MSKIAFIGLGNMGTPMARNLVAAGHMVGVYDLVPERMAELKGVSVHSSASDAAEDADVVISMLPAGRHVEALYLGKDGLLAFLRPDTLIIDCSTIDPGTARKVAAQASRLHLDMLDAPVSGGTLGAANGTLTFIVGGATAALERARPILDGMGTQIFHAGSSGAGQTAKVCNNMLLAVLMTGTAEAIALGVANGLDAGVLSDIMRQASGGNWVLNQYNPYPGVMDQAPASRGYQGGFLVDLMRKDLGLALDAAVQHDANVPMGSLAFSLYGLHRDINDSGALDFSSIQWLFSPSKKPSE